jgi:hypothetical protein
MNDVGNGDIDFGDDNFGDDDDDEPAMPQTAHGGDDMLTPRNTVEADSYEDLVILQMFFSLF